MPEEQPKPPLRTADPSAALALVEEQLVAFFEKFGFRRSLGQIWATIYFADGPLCQTDIRDRRTMSVGLVSASLKELEHWGMIHPVSVAGTRRTYYRAEEHLLRVVASILSKRELSVVQTMRGAVAAARWQASGPTGTGQSLDNRLRAIEEVTELYSAFAELVFVIAKLPASVLCMATEGLKALRDIDPGDAASGPIPLQRFGERRDDD